MGGTTGRRRSLIKSNTYIELSTSGRHNTTVKWRFNCGVPSFGTSYGTTDCIRMSQILYRREITSVLRSRNLVSRLGLEFLEGRPRTTRSTPTPPAEAAPTDRTAPVSVSPLALPDPSDYARRSPLLRYFLCIGIPDPKGPKVQGSDLQLSVW